MWIERLYKDILNKALNEYPIIYLSGARQVGKTSLLQHYFPKYDYVALDNPSIASKALSMPDQFFNNYSEHLIIDEIQYVPELFRIIKTLVDKKDKKYSYILTGSQNFLLIKGIQESLAGRCAILNMTPLNYSEISNIDSTKKISSTDLIIKGGYPKLWAENLTNQLWFQSYVITYLERDVRNILNVSSIRDFERFLRSVAYRTGQVLSYSDLARDIGIAVSTTKEWISVLTASQQISIVEPYYRNIGKRLVKSPKLYFNDTGLACYLNGIISKDILQNSNLLGNLWESYVYNQLKSINNLSLSNLPIWYWRTSSGEEVDFVIDYGGKFDLFEIKYAEKINETDLKGINAFEKYYGKESILNKSIICNTKTTYKINDVNILNLDSLINKK